MQASLYYTQVFVFYFINNLCLVELVNKNMFNFQSPSPKDALCQVCLKLSQWLWRRFLNFVNYFCYFVISSPWKKVWSFIWTNLHVLYSRMLCAKFGWNWPFGSYGEDDNVKNLQKDRRTTDDRWSKKLTWAFSSCELKTCMTSPTMCWSRCTDENDVTCLLPTQNLKKNDNFLEK